MENLKEEQTFRDQLSTVSKEGKRNWIYPKKPFGRFYNARNIVSAILLLVLIVTPFIKVHSNPFMLFDFPNRNFILFSIPFGPHDFHLFVLAMIAGIVFIILFTAVFGRVFCGWACPQTIFMEMVFRKIEYWIEGDAYAQKRLDNAVWTKEKIFKKTLKHGIFFGISFFISNIFLSYIIGVDKLWQIITDPPSEHVAGLISMLAFSAVFYWIFSYFREQVCTIVCPYGRLQGVLLDQDSIVIAYDYMRGEPRGKIKKDEVQVGLGDCINDKLCVEVCPTGIDIRDGIQLECINCTACIDACDYIMDKVNRPRGLIRYASLNGIEKNSKFKYTPRMIGYSFLLTILIGILGYLLITRTDFNINILRTPGLLFQEQPGNMISNLYDLDIINKTFHDAQIDIKLKNLNGQIKVIGTNLLMKPQDNLEAKFLLLIPRAELKSMNTPVIIDVYSNDKLLQEVKTSFLGPMNNKEKDE
ncbi:MAG: cytochrome c oxidase accessory protein CcoG [Ignavibacteriaceae bacterium]